MPKKRLNANKQPLKRPKRTAVASKELDTIQVRGAKEHNLQNVDIDLPKKKLIVFTGVSGSGKSSLAFDTIFAEGQRRYVESLSAYARQFIGQLEKPRYDMIRGLSPTIAIDQKAASRNPRSTVGTITEIYDYLRVLFARIGDQYCIHCGKPVGQGDAQSMVQQIVDLGQGTRLVLLAPVVENRKGEHRKVVENLQRQGFARLRVNGVVQEIENVQSLAKHKKHTIEVVVDRLIIKHTDAFRRRLTDSVELALKVGQGVLLAQPQGAETLRMSEARSCCATAYPALVPTLFSFNAPQGMCPTCNGIGTQLTMDEKKLVPDDNLSINQGALVPLRSAVSHGKGAATSWGGRQLAAVGKTFKIDFDTPWKRISAGKRRILLYGAPDRELTVRWNSEKINGEIKMHWEGVVHTMMRRYRQTRSEGQKKYYSSFMSSKACTTCHGARLRPEARHVRIDGKSIIGITAMTVGEAYAFLSRLTLRGNRRLIAEELLKEICNRLRFLLNVGLEYLSLNRSGPTLSGGEAQRIRLASQVGSELTGVLYVLDEPSIGLHQRDHIRLLDTLCHLRDIGNTLIVIEHDRETMEAADWLVDIGPGAGLLGGEIVAQGTPARVRRSRASLTGRYLSGARSLPVPKTRRRPKKAASRWVSIRKAAANNLKGIDVRIPQGVLVAVTGVSGAGKSSLINQILYPALANRLHGTTHAVGPHAAISGLAALDKVINIDQKAIGRTPRSNPATYTKVFDHIRNLFALLPESNVRGYRKGRFSFNVKGGRCEACRGDGYVKVEMHFLADVYVPCETCRAKRFNDATLAVTYKGHSIADVLALSVRQAMALFDNQPAIRSTLQTLMDVGLGYIKLGQSATTLSGGEAQRVKLARELAKKGTGKTLYILDEPTTGLHFEDIGMLLSVLQKLVDNGNTVVVIEHNLDVIKAADWIIDLGPEGGNAGGRIVAQGAPEKVAAVAASHTGRYLKQVL